MSSINCEITKNTSTKINLHARSRNLMAAKYEDFTEQQQQLRELVL